MARQMFIASWSFDTEDTETQRKQWANLEIGLLVNAGKAATGTRRDLARGPGVPGGGYGCSRSCARTRLSVTGVMPM